MIAQLSHSEPRGSPGSSIIGVRWAGSLARNSGSSVLPQTLTSSNSRPAARTKMRTVRLFTLGGSMFSVLAAMWLLLSRQRAPVAADELLQRVRQVLAVDVVVPALGPDAMGLQQHVGVRVPERRLEAVRRQLDQQPQRVLEVDGVHEPAVLDPAVADPALLQALHRLVEG